MPFNITPDDIAIPDRCPILGLKLKTCEGRQGPSSPSIDRLSSRRGYTKGNVQVISWRANNLKKDATLKELVALGDFARSVLA